MQLQFNDESIDFVEIWFTKNNEVCGQQRNNNRPDECCVFFIYINVFKKMGKNASMFSAQNFYLIMKNKNAKYNYFNFWNFKLITMKKPKSEGSTNAFLLFPMFLSYVITFASTESSYKKGTAWQKKSHP